MRFWRQSYTIQLTRLVSEEMGEVQVAGGTELVGLVGLFFDGQPMIKKVKQNIDIPLIVGGGIDTVEKAKQAIVSGADILVVGNALEKNIYLLKELSLLFKKPLP